MPENTVKDAFMRMSGKLADNREELLGDLIRQLEKLQSRTSSNGERIYQLNRQIADVNAQNLVVAQLHSSGILFTKRSVSTPPTIMARKARRW